MSCPSPTGVELVIFGESYVVTPSQVGLSPELIDAIADLEPDEQRRAVEAVLYGAADTFTLGRLLTTVFRSLDGAERVRFVNDETGRTTAEIVGIEYPSGHRIIGVDAAFLNTGKAEPMP